MAAEPFAALHQIMENTFGAQTEDKAIVLKGEGRISNLVGGVGHVNVASFNRKVLLTGEVRDEAMKTAVEREASNIEGVQSVVNELVIAPASSLSSRSGDSLITADVQAVHTFKQAGNYQVKLIIVSNTGYYMCK